MTKTIRKVTIVVAVLITSCQVSEAEERAADEPQRDERDRPGERGRMTGEVRDPPGETVEERAVLHESLAPRLGPRPDGTSLRR
jgi:hypothetical protein